MRKKVANIVQLTLFTFSATGGIEKVARCLGKCLEAFAQQRGGDYKMISFHDRTGAANGNKYISENNYTACAGKKLQLLSRLSSSIRKADIIVLQHVNLLPLAKFIKTFKPGAKIIVVAHGIEVWKSFTGSKKKLLSLVHTFVAVSSFTARKLQEEQSVEPERVQIINNCLDPYLQELPTPQSAWLLRESLGLQPKDTILLALTRLAGTERHKGYFEVIEAIAAIKNIGKEIIYILAGKYTEDEHSAIVKQAALHNVRVMMPGYIADEDIPTWFTMSNIYVLPSKKEGFGISFIEALHYALPVIAGNADGSADALLHGKLGTLVSPGNVQEIQGAIEKYLATKENSTVDKDLLQERFGFATYARQWNTILENAARA